MTRPLFFQAIGALPKNARLTVLLQLLWAVPFFLYNSYAALYMQKLGITPTQIGLISSAGFLGKTLVSLFAGSLIDYLGRKISVILFDAVSWLIPLFLWAVADSAWQFFLAGIINSVVVVNGIAVQFYLVEDNDDRGRLLCFTVMDAVNISAGLLAPVTGLLIEQFSLVPTLRGVYLFGFACMLILIAMKAWLLTETGIGAALKGTRKPSVRLLRDVSASLRYIASRRRLASLMVASILNHFGLVVSGLFLFPFLTGQLGVLDKDVALFPFVSSAITIAALLFVNPRVRRSMPLLGVGLMLNVVSLLPLLAAVVLMIYGATAIVFAMLALHLLTSAASKALVNPFFQLVIAGEIDDERRANVTGHSNMISMLCMLPAGFIGGMLYQMNPVYAFYLVLLVNLVSFACFLIGVRGGKKDSSTIGVYL